MVYYVTLLHPSQIKVLEKKMIIHGIIIKYN